MEPHAIATPLLAWYDVHGRRLPWRGLADPYAVWVSEIMLQQTRVETVLRYFAPFLARFPTVDALSRADEQEVLLAWAGLGYYRRARLLHRGARHVVAQGGALPRDVPGWLAIPGIGRYTAGAIVSAVWNTRVPILDGNVERVLCRLARIGEDTASGPVRARLWALADALLPTDRPGDCNQALMDLGATVCTPSAPDCPSCPLRPGCEAAGVGDVSRFPAAKHRPASPVEDRVAVVVFDADGRTLLRQRGDTGLLPRLWEPPNEERGEGRADEVARHIAEEVAASSPRAAGRVEHVFTHRIWRIDVFVATASIAPPGYAWVDEHASERPLPTATKKQIRIGRAAISEVGAGEATAAPSPARPRARTGSRRAPPHPA